MRLDHVVLWVEDALRSVAFFQEVVGLEALRVEEFKAKQTPFPSMRVSDDTIIDLVPRALAERVNALPGAKGTAGHLTNHVCLSMSEEEFEALLRRLEARGTPGGHFMEQAFGARGRAPRTFYFHDPDGNILEARYY